MKKKKNRYRSASKSHKGLVRRLLKRTLGVLGFATFTVLISAAFAQSYYALLDAPWLQIDTIEISGLKRLERKDILNTLGVSRKTGVLAIRPALLNRKLESIQWLRSSTVRLDPPRRLVVELVERDPMAVVKAEDTFLMDQDGVLFAKGTAEGNPDLPLISGISGLGLKLGYKMPAELDQNIRELLPLTQRCGEWLPKSLVAEYRWTRGAGMDLLGAGKSSIIHFGADNFGVKMERLKTVMHTLQERQWTELVTRIDLDYPNRAYVEGRFPPFKGS